MASTYKLTVNGHVCYFTNISPYDIRNETNHDSVESNNHYCIPTYVGTNLYNWIKSFNPNFDNKKYNLDEGGQVQVSTDRYYYYFKIIYEDGTESLESRLRLPGIYPYYGQQTIVFSDYPLDGQKGIQFAVYEIVKDNGGNIVTWEKGKRYYRSGYSDNPAGFPTFYGSWDSTKTKHWSDLPKVDVFPGPESGTGGGEGTFDSSSDPVDFPPVPTLSAVSAGFVSLYAPTLSQMNNLSSYMWSDAFDISNFKKLFADPMDVVIGLSIVPVSVPKGADKEIKIGLVSTGVTMTQAASQYVTVDCGTIDVKEYWGSALDYSPYTKFSIYLPYIGTRDIKTDDIMGKTVQVKYNIDILSGSCTAMIKCGESVLYEYSGSCASSIPLTGNNWTSLVTAGIQLAGMGIAAAATGGASVAAAPTAATLGKAAGSAATYAAGNVSSMKPTVQRSGGVSGSAGMLGIQRPYLIAELPRQSLAENYKTFVGYPSNITKKLSELTGYTEIEDVHLEDIPATTSELEEIHNLLVNGVIM